MKKSMTILLAVINLPLAAQWLNHPDPRTPRSKDGKPNLTAPAPRLNGKPDLSGLWQAERTSENEFTRVLGDDFGKLEVDLGDFNKHAMNVFWGVKPEEEPLRPEGSAVLKQRNQAEFPFTHCLPAGVPLVMFVYAFKMIQAPQEIVLLSETGDPARQIYTDGRSLPNDPESSWMGYSVGKWQGDTLVVESVGFNPKSWLDAFGHARSESMRITERFRRRDFGHMDLQLIVDDPKYYTRPFTVTTGLRLIPDSDVLEYVCAENEKDRVHLGN
jgi:hypothetical protein